MASCQYGTYEDLTKIYESPGKSTDHKEEEEESFVLNTLLEASDEGNVQEIEDLLQDLPNINLNVHNKHLETALHFASAAGHHEVVQLLIKNGANVSCQDKHSDSPLYWAARQGHLEVIKCLIEAGAEINATNKMGGTSLHAAVRYSQLEVVKYLCSIGADTKFQDVNGETVLHLMAWLGCPRNLCDVLAANCSDLNIRNKNEETALHVAAGRNSMECLQSLVAHSADIDATDKRGSSPLHLACHCQHLLVTKELLLKGCNVDATDMNKDTPLHVVCQSANRPIVQQLCAYGCNVNIVNKMGRSPLHISAKLGHTEIVRCLLLAGAAIDLPSKNNITAEMMALARGKNDTSELLAKLSSEKDRQETLIKQFLPSANNINKIKLKVFGESGVGKTRFVNSLKCGFFGNLLKRAGLRSGQILPFPSSPTHSSKNTSQLVTDTNQKKRSACPPPPDHEYYTQGIDVQMSTISGGVGDVSIWEFSGYEAYYQFYDVFIGDVNCIHVVCFNLHQPIASQMKEINSWLNFIKSCIPASEPIGFGGVLQRRARVVLAGILLNYWKPSLEEEPDRWRKLTELSEFFSQVYSKELLISSNVFAIDPDFPMSAQMKSFRKLVADIKDEIYKDLPRSNGFLESTVVALPGWRRVLSSYPVVTWSNFIEYIRSTVNLLASEEHIKELIYKLQLMGEVTFMETTLPGDEDLIILDVKWLCNTVLGRLLSYEVTSKCRPTGCFGSDDFQILFSDCEAVELLQLLQTLAFCTRCDLHDDEGSDSANDRSYNKSYEGSVVDSVSTGNSHTTSLPYNLEGYTTEYEVPCLNFVETLGGLWDRNDVRLAVNTIYAGCRYIQVCDNCQNLILINQPPVNIFFTSLTRSPSKKFSFMSASFENLSSKQSHQTSDCDSPPLTAPPPSPLVPGKSGQCHNYLAHLFPRVQVMLRRHCMPDKANSEIDLYQWHWGSKYCRGLLEVLVTYEPRLSEFDMVDDSSNVKFSCDCRRGFIELKCRGPADMAIELFEFAESIKEVIKNTIQLCYPSLDYKQEILSAAHLSDHRKQIKSYTQKEIIEAFTDSDGDFVVSFQECNGKECYESLLDLLALGNEIVYNRLVPSPNLAVSILPLNARRKLATLLDPSDVTGCDWCMLAILLGLSEQMPALDLKDESRYLSKTDRVLEVWSSGNANKSNSLIGVLISKLKDLNRVDAIDVLTTYGPLYNCEKVESKSECLDYISGYSHDIGVDQYSSNGVLHKKFCDTNGLDISFASADFLF